MRTKEVSFGIFRRFCEVLNYELFYGKHSYRAGGPGEYGVLGWLGLTWQDKDIAMYLELARSLAMSMLATKSPHYTVGVSFIPEKRAVLAAAFRALNSQYEDREHGL